MKTGKIEDRVFDEVYGKYYRIAQEAISLAQRGALDRKTLNELVRRGGFEDGYATVPQALTSGEWLLLDKTCHTVLTHDVNRPLTLLEKRWLKAVFNDPRIRLFDPPEEGLEEVEPLFDQDFFLYYDRYADGDPFEDPAYIERFRTILRGLREQRVLQLCYLSAGDGKATAWEGEYFPDQLEYSAKDDKFRLLAHSAAGSRVSLKLSRIAEVSLGRKISRQEPPHRDREKKTMVIYVEDERAALERTLLHFSDLDKVTRRLDETHYRMELTYYEEDESEILIRILSFGPFLKVEEPEDVVEKLRERLLKQTRLS